jgi:phytoene synthase
MALDQDLLTLARAEEADRYFAATLAPAERREALVTLAAFAAELRRIPRLVTEPMMGEVRLQWWRDTIASFGTDATGLGHPLADRLRRAVRTCRLPSAPLLAMTEARAFDLYDDPMPDEAALTGYLARTEAGPFALAMQALRPDDASLPLHLAERAGFVYGLTRILAELPYHVSRGRRMLPETWLSENSVDRESMMQGRATPELRVAIAHASTRIEAALSEISRQSSTDRVALLPLAVVPIYLRRLRDPAHDPLRHPIDLAPLTRLWRIARARVVGL